MYVKLKQGSQKRYPLWENIVLFQAESEDEAFAKAECRGREEEGDDDGSFRWDNKPAEWVFGGVRKLVLCEEEGKRPKDGTEISYSEIEAESKEALGKFINGEPVAVKFRDRYRAGTLSSPPQ
jgi:hypothetical protein